MLWRVLVQKLAYVPGETAQITGNSTRFIRVERIEA